MAVGRERHALEIPEKIMFVKPKIMIRYSLLYLTLVFLFSCTAKEEEKNDTVKTNTIPANNNEVVQIRVDSVELPSFEIELSLSQKAEEKLKTNKETIIVAAYFSAIPKDTTNKDYVKYGEVTVTSKEKELTNERLTKFEGIKFPRSLYDSLNAESITLLINVYSGRRSLKDNILDCEILHRPVEAIKGNKFTLKGKLIGE